MTSTIQTARRRVGLVSFSAAAAEAPPRASDLTAVLTDLPDDVLDGGEIVILAIKPSPWRAVFDSAPWLVTCGLLAMAVTWLGTPIPGFSITSSAQLFLLVGLARLGLAIVRWVPTWYVLTNRRIVKVRGVRRPRISACRLVDIRNTYLQPSQPERLLGLGTITFITDDPDHPPHVWRSVRDSEKVHARIRKAIEQSIDQHSGL